MLASPGTLETTSFVLYHAPPHLTTTSWGRPPLDPSDPLKQKQVWGWGVEKQSLGHPQVMESALHLPGLGASFCLLPTPRPPTKGRMETGQGQALTQTELGVLIWVPEQLLIVPWGAGLVQNFFLLSLPLGASGESGILLNPAKFSPDRELLEGRSGSQHPAQCPAHSRCLRMTLLWSLLCARHCSKSFTNVSSFHALDSPAK